MTVNVFWEWTDAAKYNIRIVFTGVSFLMLISTA